MTCETTLTFSPSLMANMALTDTHTHTHTHTHTTPLVLSVKQSSHSWQSPRLSSSSSTGSQSWGGSDRTHIFFFFFFLTRFQLDQWNDTYPACNNREFPIIVTFSGSFTNFDSASEDHLWYSNCSGFAVLCTITCQICEYYASEQLDTIYVPRLHSTVTTIWI